MMEAGMSNAESMKYRIEALRLVAESGTTKLPELRVAADAAVYIMADGSGAYVEATFWVPNPDRCRTAAGPEPEPAPVVLVEHHV
jgi:hypothetical protein